MQTVPVSHFGHIYTARAWLVVTNPAGDIGDPSVGTFVNSFGVPDRSGLEPHTETLFHRFSGYFDPGGKVHDFFKPFQRMLDGIDIEGVDCTFANGQICAVDAIKCPTKKRWSGFMRGKFNGVKQGTSVWHNCGWAKGKRHFVLSQLEEHKPMLVVFFDGLLPRSVFGKKNNDLVSLWPHDLSRFFAGVWTLRSPRRIGIGLRQAGEFQRILTSDPSSLDRMGAAVNRMLDTWSSTLSQGPNLDSEST
jgi:hypothetical protein